MPSELLHIPPAYVLVGIYRLLTDPFIRQPVLDKIKHASVRGLIVGLLYSIGSWRILNWFVRKVLLGRAGWLLGGGARARVGEAVKESVAGVVKVGLGPLSFHVDLVLYTHLLILLPQVSSILRMFIYKNLRIARSRAWALTVSSRGKPSEFWSQGYIEEWAQPPKPSASDLSGKGGRRTKEARWLSWLLWWPTQVVLRHYILLPLSPTLPLLSPLVTALLRGLTTAEYLHQPYFDQKDMSPESRWTWVEERMWAYRTFGFAASLLERIPIVGLFFSISNRIGAAMWAFDLEKRQHLFANEILKPLQPNQVGLFGMGSVTSADFDVQAAEDGLERKWSKKADNEKGIAELKGEGIGASQPGEERVL
ncbi:hypothetical protein BD324DRAFT_626069 [Kockovaella imperatae]|uniref:Uncharacterized protein n=1 Tax=Kockovaella imperatae TaxID=4999 RepID=A0A1Y1UIM1_9TREE|nr:hypothetical protein BD324DRAFT_626069 [Kockovaella imperatae]ORX37407.1 hypothetical protein BD324DRAFT_626069 [Kockovaella imperatae]